MVADMDAALQRHLDRMAERLLARLDAIIGLAHRTLDKVEAIEGRMAWLDGRLDALGRLAEPGERPPPPRACRGRARRDGHGPPPGGPPIPRGR
jgi:hypothetical protein